jgi:hypothetical protein
LNMYYSKIKIITFWKVTTMSICIILKNFVWAYRECNFCHYWITVSCIHPRQLQALIHSTLNNQHTWVSYKTF